MDSLGLPVDVLALVFDELIQRDLKNVRLVCRPLHQVAPRLRVPRVFLSPNRTNIDAFNGIAATPALRDQVCEIIWDETRLKHYEWSQATAMDQLLGQQMDGGHDSPTYASERFAEDFRVESLGQNEEKLFIDTNYEYIGICCQLFMPPDNSSYTKTIELFQTVHLTGFELALNVWTAGLFRVGKFSQRTIKDMFSKADSSATLCIQYEFEHAG
ncbi:hypothetical protein NX059_010792 [Plenodomus lindquistii]|nr:hypothetical protein NX059_010792 [Plenodomus lindquistii]